MEQEPGTKKSFPLRSFLIVLFLFSLNLAFGILVALRINEFFAPEEKEIIVISLKDFFLNFVLALSLILIVLWLGRKFKEKRRFLLKGLFLIAVTTGAFISWGVFLGDAALILVFLADLLWLWKPSVILQDILVSSAIAGAGSLLGLKMSPETVVLLLIIFSIYDYIAVYKTKHMVKMAKEMIGEGAIIGLILPQRISDFQAPIREVSPGGERFFVLGGGDIVFPLLLSASLLTRGLAKSVTTAVFSLAGLAFSFWLFFRQKERKAIPALPPIAFFAILGFLITLFLG